MYRLTSVPDSAALSVRMVLEELGQPYQIHALDKEAGEQDSPAYRARQPLGLVPALETPDGPMFETAAILLWLADRHGGELAPAPQDRDRAAFLKWFFFVAHNVHPTLLQFFYPARVAGEGAVDGVLAHAHGRMQSYLALVEAMVADEAPAWASPDRAGIFAIYLGMMLRWMGSLPAEHPGHFRAAHYPALYQVLSQLELRPSVQAVARAEDLGAKPFTDPSA